jgi:hypothetical protein
MVDTTMSELIATGERRLFSVETHRAVSKQLSLVNHGTIADLHLTDFGGESAYIQSTDKTHNLVLSFRHGKQPDRLRTITFRLDELSSAEALKAASPFAYDDGFSRAARAKVAFQPAALGGHFAIRISHISTPTAEQAVLVLENNTPAGRISRPRITIGFSPSRLDNLRARLVEEGLVERTSLRVQFADVGSIPGFAITVDAFPLGENRSFAVAEICAVNGEMPTREQLDAVSYLGPEIIGPEIIGSSLGTPPQQPDVM